MAMTIGVLALFVGLIGIYLSADTKQSVEAKVKQYSETHINALKKSIDHCRSDVDALTDRFEKLESGGTDYPEFKKNVTEELGKINKSLAKINEQLTTSTKPTKKTKQDDDFKPLADG